MKFLLKTWFFSIFWLLVSQAIAQSWNNKENSCSSWNVLRFSDGSQACMTDYKFFTVRHLSSEGGIAPLTIEKKDFPQISSVFTIIREQSSSTMDVTQLLDPSNSLLTYDPSTSEHPIINGIVLEPFYETPSTRNPDGSITPGHKTYKL